MNKKSQQGFAHAFLIIGLVVTLIGALGFVFWQNFIHKEPVITKTETQVVKQTELKKLPDMIVYTPAINIKSEAETAKLTNAPESLKSFFSEKIADLIAAHAAKVKEGDDDKCPPSVQVDQIYKQRYAVGGAVPGCVGAGKMLWFLTDGLWKEAAATQQGVFSCGDLETNKVPSVIGGSTCFDTSGENGFSRQYGQV